MEMGEQNSYNLQLETFYTTRCQRVLFLVLGKISSREVFSAYSDCPPILQFPLASTMNTRLFPLHSRPYSKRKVMTDWAAEYGILVRPLMCKAKLSGTPVCAGRYYGCS